MSQMGPAICHGVVSTAAPHIFKDSSCVSRFDEHVRDLNQRSLRTSRSSGVTRSTIGCKQSESDWKMVVSNPILRMGVGRKLSKRWLGIRRFSGLGFAFEFLNLLVQRCSCSSDLAVWLPTHDDVCKTVCNIKRFCRRKKKHAVKNFGCKNFVRYPAELKPLYC